MTIAIILVLGFLALAVIMAAPRRKHQLPATEQFVLSLLHLSAWIERTATAMDAAIVRYRIERRCLAIDMESTRTRLLEADLECLTGATERPLGEIAEELGYTYRCRGCGQICDTLWCGCDAGAPDDDDGVSDANWGAEEANNA